LFGGCGLCKLPKVLAEDLDNGYLLHAPTRGSTTYLQALARFPARMSCIAANHALLQIQLASRAGDPSGVRRAVLCASSDCFRMVHRETYCASAHRGARHRRVDQVFDGDPRETTRAKLRLCDIATTIRAT
jgi:hypothetical protein